MADIAKPVVLATINARYTHASLGLRYLIANAGALADSIALVELVSGRPIERMADRILASDPRIVGFGVYIWNVRETEALLRVLRSRRPDLVVVLGGPEVSHELDRQPIAALADHVIQGPGDISFARLLEQLLHGPRPLMKVIAGEQPALDRLALPYHLYTDHDLSRRTLYVEASRGCPFKCEFCLSALDKTAWPFPLPALLDALAQLHARGARRFKFVDRTFNLKPATGIAILAFFLTRIEATPDDPCFIHFELIPDHLPESLKAMIARFPAGTLQFEIGIQTFDPAVQQRISRRQDNARAETNLRWLRDHSTAHLHVDLIAGLPGETLAGFAAGFDRLVALEPHEIQLGLLKRLRGTPIIRHTETHRLDFDPQPPYTIRANDTMSADDITLIARTARFHDLVVNAGRMPSLAGLLLGRDQPDVSAFERLSKLATALERRFARRHAIGQEALIEAVVDWLAEQGIGPRPQLERMAVEDYLASGACGRLAFMRRGRAGGRPAAAARATPPRQRQHQGLVAAEGRSTAS